MLSITLSVVALVLSVLNGLLYKRLSKPKTASMLYLPEEKLPVSISEIIFLSTQFENDPDGFRDSYRERYYASVIQ